VIDGRPTVSVVTAVLNEEAGIEDTLESVAVQTYPNVIEILVADGGSTDDTRALAASFPGVRVLDNPGRIQARGLNVALDAARGEVVVRVDGHCSIAPDYVARCVEVLGATGAAVVGGAMNPVGDTPVRRGIAAAMRSRLGAGPARFHVGGRPGPVDTVYLGAYRRDLARQAGGYAPDLAINEDAEFAYRMSRYGDVWFDPTIRSTYVPRGSLDRLGRQFFRYGRGRAATVKRHPGSLHARQLAAPLLVVGLLSPWRRQVAAVYAAGVFARTLLEAARDPAAAPAFAGALPLMHLAWGTGFWLGLADRSTSPEDAPTQPVHADEGPAVQWRAVDWFAEAAPGA
jgi:glycosyltransferase involved in cell wall biosynthesis